MHIVKGSLSPLPVAMSLGNPTILTVADATLSYGTSCSVTCTLHTKEDRSNMHNHSSLCMLEPILLLGGSYGLRGRVAAPARVHFPAMRDAMLYIAFDMSLKSSLHNDYRTQNAHSLPTTEREKTNS